MIKKYDYSLDLDENVEGLLRESEFLGEGHNGIVYKLPGDRIIKIFRDEICCKKEANIFKRVKNSKYFPRIYSSGSLYVIRDMVHGIRLDDYIKKHGMSKELGKKLYYLLKEFKKLKFTRIDIRCKDIYVKEDGNIMVIDPKNSFSKKVIYPRHLMKGLSKIGALGDFLKVVEKVDKKSCHLWKAKIEKYFKYNIK